MRDLINNFFGNYVIPTYEHTTTVTETTTDGSIITTTYSDWINPSGLAGVDWAYVVGALVFLLMLWSVVKCVHILLKRFLTRY